MFAAMGVNVILHHMVFSVSLKFPNQLRIPTGTRQTSLLFTKSCEVDPGMTRDKSNQ